MLFQGLIFIRFFIKLKKHYNFYSAFLCNLFPYEQLWTVKAAKLITNVDY